MMESQKNERANEYAKNNRILLLVLFERACCYFWLQNLAEMNEVSQKFPDITTTTEIK